MAAEFPRITHLYVDRFLSFGEPTLVEFGPLTFLVGRNGAGKSNLFRALRLLSELSSSPTESVFTRLSEECVLQFQDGTGVFLPGRIGLVIRLETDTLQYRLSLGGERSPDELLEGIRLATSEIVVEEIERWFVAEDPIFPREPFGGGPFPPEIEVMSGWSNERTARSGVFLPIWLGPWDTSDRNVEKGPLGDFAYAFASVRLLNPVPDALRDPALRTDRPVWMPDGATAADRFANAPEQVRTTIKSLLAFLLPDFEDVYTEDGLTRRTLLFVLRGPAGRRVTLDAASMSDGTLRAFALLVGLYTAPRPSVLLVEEPELGLHPAAQAAIRDAILEASDSVQVIVSTQSPELLASDWIKSDMIRIVRWEDGRSVVARLSEEAARMVDAEEITAGELLRSRSLE